MSEEVKKTTDLSVIKLEMSDAHKVPQFLIMQGAKFVSYGLTNNYSDYLLELFRRSPLHASIVQNKIRYIAGGGLELVSANTASDEIKAREWIKKWGNNLALHAATSQQMFGGYAWQLRYSPNSGRLLNVIPQQWRLLRLDADLDYVIKSTEWTQATSIKANWRQPLRNAPIDADYYPIVIYIDAAPEGYVGMLYNRIYSEDLKAYPLPPYAAGVAAIETDAEIKNFNLVNIRTGFSAGTMISLNNGLPDPDAKSTIERNIKSKVSGTDNAGEIIINWAIDKEHAPEVLHLKPNELADQYINLEGTTRDAILAAHEAVSPMLFGIRVNGQLGGRSEIIEAYELFKATYIYPYQFTIEKDLNEVLKAQGINAIVRMKETPPISTAPTFNDIKADLTQNERREMAGFKPVKTENTPIQMSGDDVDRELLEMLAKFGEPNCQGEDGECVNSSDEAEELENKFYQQFADPVRNLDEDTQKVYDLLAKDGEVTIAAIQKATGLDKIRVLEILNNLQTRNILNYKIVTAQSGELKIKPSAIERDKLPAYGVQVRYVYSGPKDNKNREFCKAILAMDRIYTRQQIDLMSASVGRDVWKYRGGWYTLPDTGVHRPSCRHTWRQKFIRVQNK